MSEKVTGYILLVIGIVTMFYTVFNVYQVFTKQTKPVVLFNIPALQIDLSQLVAGSLPPGVIPQGQKQELISSQLINDPLNIIAHLFLMGFVAQIGFKLASIGTMLVRPIVVKLKEKNENQTANKTS